MAAKVMIDLEYLDLKKHYSHLCKSLARTMFYHRTDKLLRDVNAFIVKCKCSQCLHPKENNYPSSHPMEVMTFYVNPANNEIQLKRCPIVSDDGKNRRIGDKDIIEDDDEIEVENENTLIHPNRSCKLADLFVMLCHSNSLPIPSEEELANRDCFSLWKMLGHKRGENGVDGEIAVEGDFPPCLTPSWRNKMERLPYSTQVQFFYGGLMVDLALMLRQIGRQPPIFYKNEDQPFDEWFRFKDCKLF